MFKKKYYCLVAGLPDLFFNENKPGAGSVDFRDAFAKDLNFGDFELVKTLFFPTDNKNLLNLLFETKEPFNDGGLFSKQSLESEIEKPKEIPEYMSNFIRWVKKQETKEKTLDAEIQLQTLFYSYLLNVKNSFLHDWFLFELNIKNVMTTFNCTRFKYDTDKHIIQTWENKNVNTMLSLGRLKPEYYEDDILYVQDIFRVAESEAEMQEKEKNIDKIKWEYLEEQTFFHFFSIEKILSFLLKLQITERWLWLDKETGTALLEKLINEIKTSYEFPAEFSISK